MNRKYSLVHLTQINSSPPEMINIANKVGYDFVSLRTIPMGLAGEKPHDLVKNKTLLKETRKAMENTGVKINDIENARIYDKVNIQAYEPMLEVAAKLGVEHVLTNIWSLDKTFYTEKLCELCELAANYNQTVNVEFVTWSPVSTMLDVKELLLKSNCENVGIVVDTMHFYQSECSLTDFESMPKKWFNFVHICDNEKIITDQKSLIHTGRSERLYPGDGIIDIQSILKYTPNAICGLEVPNLNNINKYGFEEHARRAILKLKLYLNELKKEEI